MNYRIKLYLGNDDMQTGADVARVLRELAERLELEQPGVPPPPGPISLYDRNGNRIGFAERTGPAE